MEPYKQLYYNILIYRTPLESRRIHPFPLFFLITAELIRERYAQLAEAAITVGNVLRLKADARGDLSRFEYIVTQVQYKG